MFWVSGKAGCRKSTFMKFVSSHKQTLRALQAWAGQARLVIAEFYFWYAGSLIQKSVQGLLQSILFQILSKCPEMVREACPERWDTIVEADGLTSPSWTENELCKVLQRMLGSPFPQSQYQEPRLCALPSRATSRTIPTVLHRFCFFIDGLDEYASDQLRLTCYLRDLAQSVHFKICVASRPWNVFNGILGTLMTRIDMEHFTRSDISRCVRESMIAALRATRCFRSGD